MSKELKGRFGKIVGSEAYFDDLNVEHMADWLMRGKRSCDYYAALRALNGKIYEALDEIHGDLRSHCDIIRYIAQKKRDNLADVISQLMEVCGITGGHVGRAKECLELLSLRTTATKKQSRATDREIEQGVKLVLNGKQLNKRERIETLRRAVEFGERRAVGNSKEKVEFLQTLMDGRKSDYLADVWASLDYDTNARKMTGKCGQELCSPKYVNHIEKHIFSCNLLTLHGSPSYQAFLMDMLMNIAEELRVNLKYGEARNDYITDESAARIKEVIAALERCGVKYSGSKERIDRLAWFVGGDPQQIRELQRMLNELGIEGEKGKLKVDGVYSPNTHSAWLSFLNKLENGAVPALAWVDPFQTDLTNISIDATTNGKRDGFSNAFMNGKHPFIRADPPRKGETAYYRGVKRPIDYNHINFDEIKNPSPIYSKIQPKFNYYPLSDKAYKILTNMEKIGKQVRFAGKVLFIAGVVLDALELGLAISADVKDIGKWGYEASSTAAGIVGRWAGAIAGAKLGAMAGATAGTAVVPGPGTVVGGFAGGLVLGIVGAVAGDEFARWILDISCLEE